MNPKKMKMVLEYHYADGDIGCDEYEDKEGVLTRAWDWATEHHDADKMPTHIVIRLPDDRESSFTDY